MTTVTAITIFNARIGADRREYFLPTVISGASFLDSHGSGHSGGASTETLSYKLRIPFDAAVENDRTYVPEDAYKAMDDAEAMEHWTLRKGDYIAAGGYEGAQIFAHELPKNLIRIVEYADNTIRGSEAVKHWRIGGA